LIRPPWCGRTSRPCPPATRPAPGLRRSSGRPARPADRGRPGRPERHRPDQRRDRAARPASQPHHCRGRYRLHAGLRVRPGGRVGPRGGHTPRPRLATGGVRRAGETRSGNGSTLATFAGPPCPPATTRCSGAVPTVYHTPTWRRTPLARRAVHQTGNMQVNAQVSAAGRKSIAPAVQAALAACLAGRGARRCCVRCRIRRPRYRFAARRTTGSRGPGCN